MVHEAYACGVPVIAAGHGGLAKIVRHGSTGLHFAPGNVDDLAAKVGWAWKHTQEMEAMGSICPQGIRNEIQCQRGPQWPGVCLRIRTRA